MNVKAGAPLFDSAQNGRYGIRGKGEIIVQDGTLTVSGGEGGSIYIEANSLNSNTTSHLHFAYCAISEMLESHKRVAVYIRPPLSVCFHLSLGAPHPLPNPV